MYVYRIISNDIYEKIEVTIDESKIEVAEEKLKQELADAVDDEPFYTCLSLTGTIQGLRENQQQVLCDYMEWRESSIEDKRFDQIIGNIDASLIPGNKKRIVCQGIRSIVENGPDMPSFGKVKREFNYGTTLMKIKNRQ